MDCFGTYFTHAQSCDNVRVPSATEWTASVHTLHMPKAVITFVFQVLLGTCSICAFSRFRVWFSRFRVFVFGFRVFAFCRRHPRGRATHFVCTESRKSPKFEVRIHPFRSTLWVCPFRRWTVGRCWFWLRRLLLCWGKDAKQYRLLEDGFQNPYIYIYI